MIRAEVLVGVAAALALCAWFLRSDAPVESDPAFDVQAVPLPHDSLFESGSLGVPEER